MNKKILASVLVIGLLVTGVGVGAYFIDTEKIGENVITAGTLDLTVEGETHIVIDNIAPGWKQQWSWELTNTGSLDGELSWEIKDVVNKENGRNEPEIAAGDTSDDVGEPS